MCNLAATLIERFVQMNQFSKLRVPADWQQLIVTAMIGVAAIGLGVAVQRILFFVARRAAQRRPGYLLASMVHFAELPSRVIIPTLFLLAAVPWFQLRQDLTSALLRVLELTLIAAFGWMAIAILNAIQEFIAHRYTTEAADNLATRRMRTQVQVLRHIAVAVVVMVTVAIMLMTFPSIRHLGESLFASAGLAALVAGLAARTTLTSLLAGFQIALTQPIRLDDAVVVEGEWGWIEEITTTYVIVRIWDLRRLVVPLSYFIEKPFQNWTRSTADLL